MCLPRPQSGLRSLPVAVVLLASLALVPTTVAEQGRTSEEIYREVSPCVATLVVKKNDGSRSIGSAFLTLKEGLAITSWHLVKDAAHVTAKFATGDEYEVSGLIDKDQRRDLAAIRIKVFGKPRLRLLPEEPSVGTAAYVVGAPEGLESTISSGLLSQVRTIDHLKLYQFSCPASAGSSGGPLVNDAGEAIGVVSFQITEGQNLNFAIPSTYALGLDVTLPTQPWTSVQSSPQITGTSHGRMDRLLLDAVIACHDLHLAIMVAEKEVARRKRGYRAGVPVYLYAYEREARSLLGELEQLGSGYQDREEARKVLTERLEHYTEGADLLAKSIREAQSYDGWTPAANDLLSKALSYLRVSSKHSQESISSVLAKMDSTEFTDDTRYLLGRAPDPSAFKLGAYVWLRNPTTLAFIMKGSAADKMGFRNLDQILEVEGERVESLVDFKSRIERAVGERIRVRIWRGGKDKRLKIRVPRNLVQD